MLVLLAATFAGLRGIAALSPSPEDSAISTEQVVVVGVNGRYQLTEADRKVLGSNLDNAAAGAMSVRPRYIGDCAAAGWATLGAGRRTGVGGLCNPRVRDGQVTDWSQRVAAAAANNGDAQLGTLARSVPGCVAAVGPGAALAAARPDGSVTFQTVAEFVATGSTPGCPITFIDAGNESDQIITQLAQRQDVTLFVTGIGPAAGSDNPGVQVVYRVGTTLPGWLTSESTRRYGVVTLADLTRTLIDFGQGDGGRASAAIDGAPLQIEPDRLSVTAIQAHLRSVAALSDAAVTGYVALGVGGAVLLVIGVAGTVAGRFTAPKLVLTFGSILGAAMMLTGAVRWYESSSPALMLGLLVAAWGVILTSAAVLLARKVNVPAAVAGAALTVAAFTTDAALGAVMQPGSMLNSRPVAGARWYGFGNVTFSVYAASGLVLAGYLAHRFRRTGHPLAALVSVATVGFGVVICQGWPSMGTDFGGVISLTPGVLWLLLVLSGVRITWAKLVAVCVGAVLAITAISYLDWRRPPAARTHLGNFVQRILDGDAVDVVVRKAVTSWDTIISPLGIASLIVGIPLWVVLFRGLLPVLEDDFSTIRPVAIAALATAILGTLLNDGGISVWITLTSLFSVIIGSLWMDRALADGQLSWAGRLNR